MLIPLESCAPRMKGATPAPDDDEGLSSNMQGYLVVEPHIQETATSNVHPRTHTHTVTMPTQYLGWRERAFTLSDSQRQFLFCSQL